MKPNQEPSVQAYVRLVRAAEALHADVSRGLVVDGLTASQFSTMKALRMNGKLSQRDIAKHILKSGGNITVIVDHLEAEGLVVRERDTTDRRIVYVSLTRAGEAAFDGLYPDHLQRIRQAMGCLTTAECEHLMVLLEKLSGETILVSCLPN